MIKPPFLGNSKVHTYSIDEILENLDLRVLFKSRWKMDKGGEEMLADLLDDDRVLVSMHPQAVYGYFPVYSEKNRLILMDAHVWSFPELKGRVIPDHYASKADGGDIIPLSAVTVGAGAVDLSKALYANNDYAEYFLFYGLAAECTETLASMINEKIDNEIGGIKTLRRSFGYPACPDLSYQGILLTLLEADRIGISLNESNQLVPEFSTTAFLIHSKID